MILHPWHGSNLNHTLWILMSWWFPNSFFKHLTSMAKSSCSYSLAWPTSSFFPSKHLVSLLLLPLKTSQIKDMINIRQHHLDFSPVPTIFTPSLVSDIQLGFPPKDLALTSAKTLRRSCFVVARALSTATPTLVNWERCRAAGACCFATSIKQTTHSTHLYQHPLVSTWHRSCVSICTMVVLKPFFTLSSAIRTCLCFLGYLSQRYFFTEFCPAAYSYTRLKEHERLASGSRAHSSRHSFLPTPGEG